MVPHPPIILPNIGKGEEKKIADIAKAYETAARTIVDQHPDTVVIISPHAPSYYDYIQISSGPKARGSMAQFRDFQDTFEIEYDTALVKEIEALCQEEGIPAGTLGRQDGSLDHGTMVPLYFLKDLPAHTRFVRVSVGGPDSLMHYKLGETIAKAAANLGRRIAVVGSGDLSHCQKAGSSYGYRPCGPAYDAKIMDIMSHAQFDRLLDLSEKEASEAMVCGQKPFAMMAGILDGMDVDAANLGHSAEFGVGYGVVTFENPRKDASRHFYEGAAVKAQQALEERKAGEDAYVQLARKAVEAVVEDGILLPVPEGLDDTLLHDRAGTFVSIHKDGQLRGCIGTTASTCRNIAEEIIHNAVSASTRDPRFPAIQPWELADLEISVDVLQPAQHIDSLDQLDVKKYGVIVSKNGKRGLLLPGLEGVDSVEEQVRIAKQKAGLDPDEKGCQLYRFEVVRHH